MKIIILVKNLTAGGAERVAAMWSKGFYDEGHNVTIVIFDKKSPITYEVPSGVKIRCVTTQTKNIYLRCLQRILKLNKLLKDERPDIIIDVMPVIWKRISMIGVKCKKISTEHNSFERPKDAVTKHSKFEKIYLNKLYDHVTVLTQADKNVIGSQLKNVTVMPNPLALEPAKVISQRERVVLATGRLDAWHYKGFDILIKAWARITEQADGWKLQIAGDSKRDGLKYLKGICNEYGVTDSVEFVGYQSDILPFYKDASIFVLSSRYEGFGLVLIEAMSQGCACIACDYKGRQKEIILSEKNGLICEPENIEALSDAMLHLIQNDDKRKEIGINAINRAHDFSIERIMNKWDSVLKK